MSSHQAGKESHESTRRRWGDRRRRRRRRRGLLPLPFLFGLLDHVQVVHFIVVVIVLDIGAAKAAAGRSTWWSAADHDGARTVAYSRSTLTVVIKRGVIGDLWQRRRRCCGRRWLRRAVLVAVCLFAGLRFCGRTNLAFDLKHSDTRHMWSAAAFGARHRHRSRRGVG